jgi:hypothetical protein
MGKFLKACLLACLFVTWQFAQHLGASAIVDWINGALGEKFGLVRPSVAVVINAVLQIGPPVAATAAILWLYHLWASVRHTSMTTADPQPKIGEIVALSSRHLKISIGECGQYSITKGRSLRFTERTLFLMIENTDSRDAVTGVKVVILSIEPQTDFVGPWPPLKANFTLASGEHDLIPLAQFGEPFEGGTLPDRYDRTDTFFEILSGKNPLSFDKGTPQTLTIRASGIGSAPCDYRCKIWVDRTDGRLRIADATDADKYLPLYEAALRLMDANIGIYDMAARELSHDDPIGWWAYWIENRVQVYGKFLPARTMRAFPKERYDLKVEGQSLVATERDGKNRWEDLSILELDFPSLLSQARAAAGVIDER